MAVECRGALVVNVGRARCCQHLTEQLPLSPIGPLTDLHAATGWLASEGSTVQLFHSQHEQGTRMIEGYRLLKSSSRV